MNYIVLPGDSLSKIARDKLGDVTLWEDLAKHNKIVNASQIFPGQVINLDIPKRVTIDAQTQRIIQEPKPQQSSSSGWGYFFGFVLSVAAGLAVEQISKYRTEKRKAK